MTNYKLSKEYFDKINIIIECLCDSLNVVPLFKLNIIENNKDKIKNKILSCGENFYDKTQLDYEHIIIIEISIDDKYIGFLTFENLVDNNVKDTINLVTIFIEKDFRKKYIFHTLLIAILCNNFENDIALVITEPTIELTNIINNVINNFYNLVTTKNIELDNYEEPNQIIEFLSNDGIMIKINYLSKQRFDSKNIRIVINSEDYINYKMERCIDGDDSINVNFGAYMGGFDKCVEQEIEPFCSNCVFMLSINK